MDKKMNTSPDNPETSNEGTSSSQEGSNIRVPGAPQQSEGFIPMSLIEDLWSDGEGSVAQKTAVENVLVDANALSENDMSNNIFPVSTTDLLSDPTAESEGAFGYSGTTSNSGNEQEFRNFGSSSVAASQDAFGVGSKTDKVPVVAQALHSNTGLDSQSFNETPVPAPSSAAVEPPVVVPAPTAIEPPVIKAPAATIKKAPSTEISPPLLIQEIKEPIAAQEPKVAQGSKPLGAEPIVESSVEPAMAAQEPEAVTAKSPVPNAIAKEAENKAQEIQENKLAFAAEQMEAIDEELKSSSEEPDSQTAAEEPVEQGISVITREATVLGDIITQGHIDVIGRVKGNIDAKGDVAIHGIVRGDIGGSKIGLYDCRVRGNLEAALGVIVDENSIIGGDVKTKNIIFDGKVKGNIDAENVVVLRSHSLTLGDVSTASLAVEPGAILNGKVTTLIEGDLEAPFEEVM